jgi:signal transduction histidine kinase
MSTTVGGERLAARPLPWARPLAGALWAASLASAAGTLILAIIEPEQPTWGSASVMLAFAVFSTVSALIGLRRPDHALGWGFAAIGLLGGLGGVTEEYVRHAVTDVTAPPRLGVLASWFQSWYWTPVLGLSLVFVPLLYPTGRLPSSRWRPVAWLAAGSVLAFTVLSAVQETLEVRDTNVVLPNPIGIGGLDNPEETAAGLVLSLALVACILAACASVVLRFRRSSGEQRLQLKWFAFAAALVPFQMLLDQVLPDRLAQTDLLFGVTLAALPIACGIAILKYRLYDIDLVINRTLVYGALTAGVIGFYVAVVTLFDTLLRRSGLGVSLVATALVAVFFQPARERLQGAVDRVMYGERRDPYRVLSRLGRRLESVPAVEQMLPSLTATVVEALRLPYAAVELTGASGATSAVAASGDPTGDHVKLPLSHHGEILGSLVVGRRAPGERFSDADFKLLEDLARQAGSAVNALRLTTELQLARQSLVTAREEERRRLRRDLHDGLGPTLAAIGLQVQAAGNLLSRDPALAERTIGDLGSKIEDAIGDIRRLVYGLRPPALDELGLAGALGEQAARSSDAGPAIRIETDGDLAGLPAAVEVAAYRIASEALMNASRHSGASECTARLERTDGALQVEVVDNGRGLAGRPTGVGLQSIRERAAELGGTCVIETAPGGGTRVWARLPCPEAT